MVNGRFVCYGPPEYIKAEYGRGIRVAMWYDEKEEKRIASEIREHLDCLVEVERTKSKVTFELKKSIEEIGLNFLFK